LALSFYSRCIPDCYWGC